MVMNLQYFGGRGGSSGIVQDANISPLAARIAYNSAKKNISGENKYDRDSQLEGIIRKIANGEDANKFASQINNEKDINKALNYLTARAAEVDKKITKLGSAEELMKKPRMYIERKAIREAELSIRDRRSEVIKEKPERLSGEQIHGRTTTTYEAARKRRIKNFDSWFSGGR